MVSDWVSDTVIEEILAEFPEQIAERRLKLGDRNWCERHPHGVRNYHDPYRARELVRMLKERENPFSRSNLTRKAVDAESRMINTSPSFSYVMRDPDTGEVTDVEHFHNDVDPSDPFVQAYVADLN